MLLSRYALLRSKLIAVSVHLLFSLCVVAFSAVLVFYVWYPGELSAVAGGAFLFFLVAGCEVIIGPCMSFVVYNPRKSFKELSVDYSVIGIIQVGALLYGLHSSFIARPVFITFAVDRLELISAVDLDASDSVLGHRLNSPSFWGPKLVKLKLPEDSKKRSDILFDTAFGGRDISAMPEYYDQYDGLLVLARAKPLTELNLKVELNENSKNIEGKIKELLHKNPNYTWIPLTHYLGAWTAVLDPVTGRPVDYLQFDPF